MSEVRQELVLWQAYWEIKMELEDAQDEIKKLRAALNKISKLNAKRDRYSQEIEDVIIAALGEKE
jgi:hypothetical protein